MIEGGEPFSRAKIAHIEDDQVGESAERCCAIVNPKLDEGKRKQLRNILEGLSDVFAADPKRPVITNRTEQVIESGDACPVKQRQLRVAPSVEVEINRQVTDMLVNGICRQSNSPY